MKKKVSKQKIAVLAAVAMCAAAAVACALFFFPRGDSEALEYFRVNPYGGSKNDAETIIWNKIGEKYYLFLPSDADAGSLRVFFRASGKVTVNGDNLTNGRSTGLFSGGGKFTLVCGDAEYPLYVMQSENIPSLFITTDSGGWEYLHKDKDNKVPGRVVVRDGGEVALDARLSHIKMRGNSWADTREDYAKAYNIKFVNKQSLLGLGKAKKWALLTSEVERNQFALTLASTVGLDYTPDCAPADVYLDGDYRGTYLVCENVQVAKNRVEIPDLKDANEAANPGVDIKKCALAGDRTDEEEIPGARKWVEIPNNPDDISGGYLIELDDYERYCAEISGFVSELSTPVEIHSPEYASRSEVDYIADYWQEAEDALYSESGFNSLGRYYTDYFDFDSLVKVFLVQEFCKNGDAGGTSCFFYKKPDGKLYAGPVWDFNGALGIKLDYEGLKLGDPSTWWTLQRVRNEGDDMPFFFAMLFRHGDFREAVKKEWIIFSSVYLDGAADKIDAMGDVLSASSCMKAVRWGMFASAAVKTLTTLQYRAGITALKKYVNLRIINLNKGFAQNAAYFRYDPNGGNGHLYDAPILSAGEEITLCKNAYSKEGMVFVGWNTAADGTGETYSPGDKVTLEAGYTVFYAQWENVP
ncbi:MAG: CotH kinase family protein [Clostridia bacterium]|nr:CotH kinase family protein [Clostridia bacterium]